MVFPAATCWGVPLGSITCGPLLDLHAALPNVEHCINGNGLSSAPVPNCLVLSGTTNAQLPLCGMPRRQHCNLCPAGNTPTCMPLMVLHAA